MYMTCSYILNHCYWVNVNIIHIWSIYVHVQFHRAAWQLNQESVCTQQVEDKKAGKTKAEQKAEQKAELAEELKVEEVQRRPNTSLVRQNRKTLRDFTKVCACVTDSSRDDITGSLRDMS